MIAWPATWRRGEGPKFINGHLFKSLAVITNIQSPAPWGREAGKSSRPDLRCTKLIAPLAGQPACGLFASLMPCHRRKFYDFSANRILMFSFQRRA
jgi:hypothetical protein